MLGIAVQPVICLHLCISSIYQLAIYQSSINYLSSVNHLSLSLSLNHKRLEVHGLVLKRDVLDSRVGLRSEGGAGTGLCPETGVQSEGLERVALVYSPR